MSDEKQSETYQMDEVSHAINCSIHHCFVKVSKKEEEANEDTPLKANDKDVEASAQTDISETKDNEKAVMASVEEKSDDKQSSALLDHPKIKVVLAIVGALLLVLLLLIVAILVIIYREGVSDWSENTALGLLIALMVCTLKSLILFCRKFDKYFQYFW